ncbi:MAG: exodeoxyribonuclease III [Pseudoxanthomonas sp.]|nr:exodeoxyribonuclease III [Pseudoxanthomonas sp.]
MKIASWNVNSLKVRLPHLAQWCAQAQPDLLALQETKLDDPAFPAAAIAELGYQAVFSGQRTYNGVALLARAPIADVAAGVPGLDDPQRRYLAATVAGVRVVNLYVVNGQAVGSEKFEYKLRWLAAVREALAAELARHPDLVVLGDFNIAPDDRDVHDPQAWHEKILCSTPEREALRGLLDLGLCDSFRVHNEEGGHYSWWDYRQAAFRRDLGLRIDLVLLSDSLRGRLAAAGIDREPRTWERPSDHAPVWVDLAP